MSGVFEWIGSIEELLTQGWRVGPCAACGQAVVTDDRIILDREPTNDGDVIIRPVYRDKAQATTAIREDVVGRIPLWRAHFYTCPRRLDCGRVSGAAWAL